MASRSFSNLEDLDADFHSMQNDASISMGWLTLFRNLKNNEFLKIFDLPSKLLSAPVGVSGNEMLEGEVIEKLRPEEAAAF